jgi:hypothetical protein
LRQEIVVTSRKFRRHSRRYRKLLDAGRELIVRRRGRSYLMQRLERVKVDTKLLDEVRAVFDPDGAWSDRQLVDEVLREGAKKARNDAISPRTLDERA